MKPLLLLRDAWSMAVANKTTTLLVALVLAATSLVTITTVGRSAAAMDTLHDRLESAGSRTLVIRDIDNNNYVTATVADLVSSISATQGVTTTTRAIDLVNGALGSGGTVVGAWGIREGMQDAVTLTSGRWPQPGEALISESARERLQLDGAGGWVQAASHRTQLSLSVVGTYAAKDHVSDITDGIVFPAASNEPVSTIFIVLDGPEAARSVQAAVVGIIAPRELADLRIESPISAAELQSQLVGDLANYSGSLLAGLLLGGGFLAGIVCFADTLVSRRDIGRRRALGATRSAIVQLIVLRILIAAGGGLFIGLLTGWLASRWLGFHVPPSFAAGLAVLSLLIAGAFATAPAVYASRQDPLRELRTP
ncbi:hypothetical protein GCM10027591_05250 [Zhihengliuella somnathii]